MSNQSDRLTSSSPKTYDENQYFVVTKLWGNKINDWKILIKRLWFFISLPAIIFSANLHDVSSE